MFGEQTFAQLRTGFMDWYIEVRGRLAIVSIAQYLIDKGEPTALHTINKTVLIQENSD